MINCFYVILLFGLHLSFSLKLTKFSVPPEESHEAHLECQYDLEGSKLYDVKWYKDDNQFFRCTVTETQEYPLEGIKVFYIDSSAVGFCSLTLTALSPKSAGIYKCEVSLEAPSFETASRIAKMKVIQASKIIQPTDPPRAQSSHGNNSNISLSFICLLFILTYYVIY